MCQLWLPIPLIAATQEVEAEGSSVLGQGLEVFKSWST
jgi:hypothetical protein